ncbi:hypothetical protein [Endozoicomonas arenosclerae]|uniref:hypothetical protein n=1 Tax=Endozoicomonas arenosclerae TaxID=1633495 RepID=UPI0007823D1F|nr:hypothetical protein [Endozoicomonas arenosclerae]
MSVDGLGKHSRSTSPLSHTEDEHSGHSTDESSGKAFNRTVDATATLKRGRLSRKTSSKHRSGSLNRKRSQSLRRRLTTRKANNPDDRSRAPTSFQEQLVRELFTINPKDQREIARWAGTLRAVEPTEQDFESWDMEYSKQAAMDILFRDLHFTLNDLDTLIKLNQIKGSDKTLSHLESVVAKQIAESTQGEADPLVENITTRDQYTAAEASTTRRFFLTDHNLSSFKVYEIKDILCGLIGRPYGLREDLTALKDQLEKTLSNGSPLSSSAKKEIKKMCDKINRLFANEQKRSDVLKVNRLVLKLKRAIESNPELTVNMPDISGWPVRFARIMQGQED